MRLFIALAALTAVFSLSATAQSFKQYYTHNWKKADDPFSARYYSLTEKKDSLWARQDFYLPEKSLYMSGTFKDSTSKVKHGTFAYFYENKKVQATGMYRNNKEQGLWLRFHENGAKADSAFYDNGRVTGLRLAWHPNGSLADSMEVNADGSGVHVSWYDDGNPAFSGRYTNALKMNGKWQFFHRNGNLSALEGYDAGQLVSRQYFDENGKALPDTANTDREADFIGGREGWKRFVIKNLNPNVPINNGAPDGKYTVVIRFVVDAYGNTTEIKPMTQMGYGMEQEAVRMIFSAPKWEPAVKHGRKIKAYRIQPVTFVVATHPNLNNPMEPSSMQPSGLR